MALQQYDLGQKVWAFKQQGDGFVKTCGIIHMAEINSAGYVQYQIKCLAPDGKEFTILANHASLANSEPEVDAKIIKYREWSDAQKADYEANFGAPEFNTEALNEALRG